MSFSEAKEIFEPSKLIMEGFLTIGINVFGLLANAVAIKVLYKTNLSKHKEQALSMKNSKHIGNDRIKDTIMTGMILISNFFHVSSSLPTKVITGLETARYLSNAITTVVYIDAMITNIRRGRMICGVRYRCTFW